MPNGQVPEAAIHHESESDAEWSETKEKWIRGEELSDLMADAAISVFAGHHHGIALARNSKSLRSESAATDC